MCAGSFTAHCLSAQPEVGGVRSCPPSWDDNWDLRKDAETTNIVRHIVLVRHGQYFEKGKKDEEQKLTPLGREQAVKTGKRLAEYLPKDHTFKLIRQSNMTRAKETAEIIATFFPNVPLLPPNALLDEGFPAEPIPVPKQMWAATDTWQHQPRIEAAFRTLFHRMTPSDVRREVSRGEREEEAVSKDKNGTAKHEYELVVCHGNVIRLFICRSLQIPPELWLRFCVFNCSISHIVINPGGKCSVYQVGDVGHLDGREEVTYGKGVSFNMTSPPPPPR